MQYFVPLLDYPSGQPVVAPIEGEAFATQLLEGLQAERDALDELAFRASDATAQRGPVEADRAAQDRGDVRAAGWTYVIHADDPQREAIIDALEPLARYRGMAAPREPLRFDGRPADQWGDWLEASYPTIAGKQRPQYFMLVGDPQRLPFEFQWFLSLVASVGRVDFAAPADYRAYADKLLRLEREPAGVTRREAVFFAPDGGPRDPTFYSRRYMAAPLAKYADEQLGFRTHTLFGEDAHREGLAATLQATRPAIVYSASHGFSAFRQPEDVQRRINGAIQCQNDDGSRVADDFIYGAAQVPEDGPFLEGAVFFQFACLGYGTPAESYFAPWLPKLRVASPTADFVAALPRRLVLHPQGPIAFIGHVDLAFLQGFTDADGPDIRNPWHPRLDPFTKALKQLLMVQPVGLALESMSQRAADRSASIANRVGQFMRRRIADSAEFRSDLAQRFVELGDARNYLLFGDPGARLRTAASRD